MSDLPKCLTNEDGDLDSTKLVHVLWVIMDAINHPCSYNQDKFDQVLVDLEIHNHPMVEGTGTKPPEGIFRDID